MSGTGEAEAAPATLIEQPGEIPETVVPAEETAETPIEVPAEAEAAPETPEPSKPKQKPWFQTRIDELTRQKHDEKRAREALEARLAALEKPAESEGPVAKPEDFDKAVTARAQQIVAQEDAKRRTNSWFEAGKKEFGAAEFNEKCNLVADIGAGDNPEFMKLVTDPDIIPDGHKVIALLADAPEEAQRILSLEPVKMAAALTRFASSAKAPEKPLSQAPRPITPIGGSAKPSTLPAESDDMKTWMEKRNAQVAARNASRH